MSGGAEALLEARGLVRSYALRRGLFGGASGSLRAVDGVSLEIAQGETLALVGESGSGKSTTARLLLRLERPTAGRIRFDGRDWLELQGADLARRRRDMQMVFQDPATSLNPRMTAGAQVAEPLRIQGLARGEALRGRIRELLSQVGLPPETGRRFPSELSGGERQRVAIARALATRPKLLVCDEPVSSLDVSVAAQVINLLAELRESYGLSTLFISHDLAVVSRVADRVAVMYRGRIVEEGSLRQVLGEPLHPYTVALLFAAGTGDAGVVASAESAPTGTGCAFSPRCPIARPRCREEAPPLSEHRPGHRAACFFAGELPSRPDGSGFASSV